MGEIYTTSPYAKQQRKRRERARAEQAESPSYSDSAGPDAEAAERYVAPPGMEHVVKKLKKKGDVANPYAIAWAMHNKEKQKHTEGLGGLHVLEPGRDAYVRNLDTLVFIADGPHNVSTEVIEQMYQDALNSIDRSFGTEEMVDGVNVYQAWRDVLEVAKEDALESVAQGSLPQGGFKLIPKEQYGEQGVPQLPDERVEANRTAKEYQEPEITQELTGKGPGIKKRKGVEQFEEQDPWLEKFEEINQTIQRFDTK